VFFVPSWWKAEEPLKDPMLFPSGSSEFAFGAISRGGISGWVHLEDTKSTKGNAFCSLLFGAVSLKARILAESQEYNAALVSGFE
jgi:hypothetical protein